MGQRTKDPRPTNKTSAQRSPTPVLPSDSAPGASCTYRVRAYRRCFILALSVISPRCQHCPFSGGGEDGVAVVQEAELLDGQLDLLSPSARATFLLHFLLALLSFIHADDRMGQVGLLSGGQKSSRCSRAPACTRLGSQRCFRARQSTVMVHRPCMSNPSNGVARLIG